MEHLRELRDLLEKIRDKGFPLKHLSIDASAWDSITNLGPSFFYYLSSTGPSVLFGAFQHCKGLANGCEIRLGRWAKASPETIAIAKELGRALINYPPLDEKSVSDPETVALRTCPTSLTQHRDEVQPIVQVEELICDGDPGQICTSWRTQLTRV